MSIAVAMSGGMDSTAAALILAETGRDVVGLHMALHSGSDQTWERARKAAAEIGVPIQLFDLSEEFRDLVVRPFVDEYSRGRTPSPCPRCNRFIKMGLLMDAARAIGCDRLATGHYARVEHRVDGPVLLKGVDRVKDQSYFLFMLTGEMLQHAEFPLGQFTKDWTRQFLKEHGISVWETDESQELCFIPKGHYRDFLVQQGVVSEPGPITDLDGRILGRHQGITSYTVGQRRGLGICGPEPLYVVRLDSASNTVIVGPKKHTFVKGLTIGEVNILLKESPLAGARFHVKVRSTAREVPCTVTGVSEDELTLVFDDPQSGVAPGQAAVLYSGERVAAGGWIEDTRGAATRH